MSFDFSSLVPYVVIAVALALAEEAVRLHRSSGRGFERSCERTVRKALGLDAAHVARNVLVPSKGRGVDEAEVDVVAVCASGVYVVECKDFGGWVSGTAGQREWAVTYPGGKKARVLNPCIQNEGHLRALAHALDVPPRSLHGFVAFSGRTTLKQVPDEARGSQVVAFDDLPGAIMLASDEAGELLDATQVEQASERLAQLKAASTSDARRRHAEQVRGRARR